jgi:hypothetical protein
MIANLSRRIFALLLSSCRKFMFGYLYLWRFCSFHIPLPQQIQYTKLSEYAGMVGTGIDHKDFQVARVGFDSVSAMSLTNSLEGSRNQEFAVAAAISMSGLPSAVF